MSGSPTRRYIGEVVLRRYLIEELVGEGSFAWVYRARDRDGDVVAVKTLYSSQSTAAVRFAREVRVLQALPENPFVAHYIDHGHTRDGRPVLILEFVDGITLKLGLERRPTLAPDQAVIFVSELCEAFVGLHQLGVAHRDVKPDNILLARAGGIKLIDFGLIRDAQGILRLLEGEDPLETRVFQDELDKGVLAGTPEYMAPEQFSDSAVNDISEARTDTWSDVFSLGVILFELLTGRKPFVMRDVPRDEYAQELLRYLRWRLRLRDKDIPRIPGISAALQSIVHKALRRDPRRRQPDARALMEDLQRFQRTGQGIEHSDDQRTQVASVSSVMALHQLQQLAATASAAQTVGEGRPAFNLFDDETNPLPATGARAQQSQDAARPAPPQPEEARTRQLKAHQPQPAHQASPEAYAETLDARQDSSLYQRAFRSQRNETEDIGPAAKKAPEQTALLRETRDVAVRREQARQAEVQRRQTQDILGRHSSLQGPGRSQPQQERGASVHGSTQPAPSKPSPHLPEPVQRRVENAAASPQPQRQAQQPPAAALRAPSPARPLEHAQPKDDVEELKTRVFSSASLQQNPDQSGRREVAPPLAQEESWPEENLADPPQRGEPAILRAPTDAPSLAAEELFDEWDDWDEGRSDETNDGYGADHFAEDSEEVNLAELAPHPRRKLSS